MEGNCALKRLGYWLSEKKSKKLSLSDIEDALRDQNIQAVRIDIESSLDSQGPFDGILHKLTDIIGKGDSGDKKSQEVISNFESFLNKNPKVVFIDSFESIRNLIDRFRTYSIMKNCDFATKETVFIPPFVVLESNKNDNMNRLRSAKVEFPVVCKPIRAHGSTDAHKMALVFNEDGLSELTFPCVVQSFINHNAILYKLYVIGEESYMVKRPSIKNLFPSKDTKTIHFHSEEISKPESCSLLTLQDVEEREITQKPKLEVLNSIAKGVHKKLNIGLFGVDVVLEPIKESYAIIDINVFPGYDGVPDFPERLASFIRAQLDKNDDLESTTSEWIKISGSSSKHAENCDGNGKNLLINEI